MPTAAKLFAAVAFLLVGFFAAEVMKPQFPEGFDTGYFSVICAGLGLLAGWLVMGPIANTSVFRGMTGGLKTSFILTVWGLTVFSIYEMVLRSLDRRYDDVVESIEDVFLIMVEYAVILSESSTSVFVLIVGGILGGLFARWAAVRWR